MMTKEQMEANEVRMFGETKQEVLNAMIFTKKDDSADVLLYATGILSDAQEAALRGDHERARQYTNKAKFLMSSVFRALRQQKPIAPSYFD